GAGGVEPVLASVRKSGAGDIVAGEGVARALHERVPVLVLDNALPMSWLACVRQVIQARIRGVVGVRSAIGVDGHARGEEERWAFRQSPDRYLTSGLAVAIDLEIEEQRSARAAFRWVREGRRFWRRPLASGRSGVLEGH